MLIVTSIFTESASKTDRAPNMASRDFDAVVFDLDDTLAPVMGAVGAANEAMMEFMREHMKETAKISPVDIKTLMKKYKCSLQLDISFKL